MHDQVEPKLREVLATSRPLRDTVNKEVAAGTAALAQDTAGTTRTAWMIIGVAVTLALTLAVLLVQFPDDQLGLFCSLLCGGYGRLPPGLFRGDQTEPV